MFQKITQTDNSKTTILIRLIVGGVFLSEGIQKFLFPASRGSGRFKKIGLPSPEFLGTFVCTFQVLCETLILLGLYTRLASIPLIAIMLVAIATTKIEILANKGFWEMLHESRTDWSMLLGSLFFLIKGGGAIRLTNDYSGVHNHSEIRDIAKLFSKLGVTAFGGPSAHITMMREEVVAKRKWLTEKKQSATGAPYLLLF